MKWKLTLLRGIRFLCTTQRVSQKDKLPDYLLVKTPAWRVWKSLSTTKAPQKQQGRNYTNTNKT